MCNDFEWPHVKETTSLTVNTVPTSVTTPTPQIESHLESGAFRQFMPAFSVALHILVRIHPLRVYNVLRQKSPHVISLSCLKNSIILTNT